MSFNALCWNKEQTIIIVMNPIDYWKIKAT